MNPPPELAGPLTVTDAWRAPMLFPSHRMPAHLRSWLTTRGSLTRRIRAAAVRFELRLRAQSWQRPTLTEADWLEQPRRERVLVREIHLCADGVPVVYGRSLLPDRILRTGRRPLGRLGNRPLGEVLFQRGKRDPGRIEWRAQMANAGSLPPATLMEVECDGKRTLWTRRALYRLDGIPLIVAETFLPGIENLPWR